MIISCVVNSPAEMAQSPAACALYQNGGICPHEQLLLIEIKPDHLIGVLMIGIKSAKLTIMRYSTFGNQKDGI